jgi:hypothetical protein
MKGSSPAFRTYRIRHHVENYVKQVTIKIKAELICEQYFLLGCDAMLTGATSPIFRRKVRFYLRGRIVSQITINNLASTLKMEAVFSLETLAYFY